MSITKEVKVRPSLHTLQKEYESGNKKPLEDVMRAWKGIKELPSTDKRSFFMLGGYHGEPFQYRQQVDELSLVDRYVYWGGYCNHGNVLFPTWHRIYILKLEEALQSIVPDVMLPYWDETNEESLKHGIPWALTIEKFELDGEEIDNPLRSFVLPEALSDFLPGDDKVWEKPKGYETVRYPLSGLVGSKKARRITKKHNQRFSNPIKNISFLNKNIRAWLHGNPKVSPKRPLKHGVFWQYHDCLAAPNYTVFSNTTSASQWNLDHPDTVTALESPHNDIHLAIGGFDIPKEGDFGIIAEANGDMGENNTAAMDPIFFFHHCNVDRMFWLWQKQNGFTEKFEILTGYAGTTSSDSQGPTPGMPPGASLGLDTPLNPFLKDEFGTVYTSQDCINIEKQLGYTYEPGSLEEIPKQKREKSDHGTKKLVVRGVDRALFQGSFVLRAYAIVENDHSKVNTYYLGHHAVLSRRNIVHCANCLTHLEVIAHFPLSDIPASVDLEKDVRFHLAIQHRGSELPEDLRYHFEISE